jgi:hypothetical protein
MRARHEDWRQSPFILVNCRKKMKIAVDLVNCRKKMKTECLVRGMSGEFFGESGSLGERFAHEEVFDAAKRIHFD